MSTSAALRLGVEAERIERTAQRWHDGRCSEAQHARIEASSTSFAAHDPDTATRISALEVIAVSDDSLDPILEHPLVTNLLTRLADLVAERINGKGNDDSGYYTTHDNPLGSGRAFRDAARRGDFPSFKIGREIAAKKSDVRAWLESRTRLPSLRKARPAPSSNVEMLDEFGLRASRKPAAGTEGA